MQTQHASCPLNLFSCFRLASCVSICRTWISTSAMRPRAGDANGPTRFQVQRQGAHRRNLRPRSASPPGRSQVGRARLQDHRKPVVVARGVDLADGSAADRHAPLGGMLAEWSSGMIDPLVQEPLFSYR